MMLFRSLTYVEGQVLVASVLVAVPVVLVMWTKRGKRQP